MNFLSHMIERLGESVDPTVLLGHPRVELRDGLVDLARLFIDAGSEFLSDRIDALIHLT
jgi:hypothetical protein